MNKNKLTFISSALVGTMLFSGCAGNRSFDAGVKMRTIEAFSGVINPDDPNQQKCFFQPEEILTSEGELTLLAGTSMAIPSVRLKSDNCSAVVSVEKAANNTEEVK